MPVPISLWEHFHSNYQLWTTMWSSAKTCDLNHICLSSPILLSCKVTGNPGPESHVSTEPPHRHSVSSSGSWSCISTCKFPLWVIGIVSKAKLCCSYRFQIWGLLKVIYEEYKTEDSGVEKMRAWHCDGSKRGLGGSKPTSDLTTNKNNLFLLYFRDEDCSCSSPELKKLCTLFPISAVRPAEERLLRSQL